VVLGWLDTAITAVAAAAAVAVALLAYLGYEYGRSEGRDRRRNQQRRHVVKELIGQAMSYGMFLRYAKDVTEGQVLRWTSVVTDVIADAFGEGEKHVWMDGAGLRALELDDPEEPRTYWTGKRAPAAPNIDVWVTRCVSALAELVKRTDSLYVRDEFDAGRWDGVFSTANWSPGE
jgi:hypothetical protein